MIEFQINSASKQLVILNGIVVTEGSKVDVGLKEVQWPKSDSALQSLKRILGIRRKRQAIVEEEEVAVAAPVDSDNDDSSDDESCDESEDEEEIIDDSD